jgi:hypothetical protein
MRGKKGVKTRHILSYIFFFLPQPTDYQNVTERKRDPMFGQCFCVCASYYLFHLLMKIYNGRRWMKQLHCVSQQQQKTFDCLLRTIKKDDEG